MPEKRKYKALPWIAGGIALLGFAIGHIGRSQPQPPENRKPDDKKPPQYAADEQSGKLFELEPENKLAIAFATISILYLLAMLAFFFWQLLDIAAGQYSLPRLLGYAGIDQAISLGAQPVAYVFVGGGLGGIVSGIRSFLVWHAERKAFGWRFVWKYIAFPWLGSTLALIVYAIIRSGVAVFSGNFGTDTTTPTPALAALAVGAIAGYGSHKVFVWLDAQVNRIFKVPPVTEVRVPNLLGKTRAEAERMLGEVGLKIGRVNEKTTEEDSAVGRIVEQTPAPDSLVEGKGPVVVTIAIRSTGK